MKVFFGIRGIKKYTKPVVVLGVFDGVHLGHRHILRQAVRTAHKTGGESIAVTFWPHPQGKQSLYSLEHRLELIGELGIDTCIVIKFSRAFSKISAKNFIKNILAAKLHSHYIFVGKNFRFGRAAKGDFRLLKRLSHNYNFKLKVFNIIIRSHQPISSTYIRSLITTGKLNAASRLLNRPVSILGTVTKGSCMARRLGFPTANIQAHHEVSPPAGIYAVRVIIDRLKILNGVCYIGSRPTFKQQPSCRRHIEVHIYDFNRDIYGKDLYIQFIKKIRDEKKFRSPGELASQIKKDIQTTKSVFSRH